MTDYDLDPCDYPNCTCDGVRHLCTYHFCNEHRWLLVERAKRQGVTDLFGFVALEVQQ